MISIKTWLNRMTSNLSYTWIKQNRCWIQPLEYIIEWLTHSNRKKPNEIIEKQDDWDKIHNAVIRLPIKQRVIFVLDYLNYFFQNYSQRCQPRPKDQNLILALCLTTSWWMGI